MGVVVVASFGLAGFTDGIGRFLLLGAGSAAVLLSAAAPFHRALLSGLTSFLSYMKARSDSLIAMVRRPLASGSLRPLSKAEEYDIEADKMPNFLTRHPYSRQRSIEVLSQIEPQVETDVEQDEEKLNTFHLKIACVSGAATEVWARWNIHFSASKHWEEGFKFFDLASPLESGKSIDHEIEVVASDEPVLPLDLPQDVDIDVWVCFKTLWGTTRWSGTTVSISY